VESPYVLDVGDLLTHPGEIRTVDFSAPLDVQLDSARSSGPVAIRARLEGLTNGVFMVGSATAPLSLVCNRCLVEWDEEVQAELRQLFTTDLDEDGYGIDDNSLDTSGLVHDEVMLAIPLAPVCRDGCQGICATCGADLNTAPCGGHDETEASPFAALRDLLPE